MLPVRRFVTLMIVVAVFSHSGIRSFAEDAKSSPAAIKQYRDAVAFQNRQLYDLAADEWQKFLTNYGKDPLAGKAQHYLGVCQLQQKDNDAAIASFEKAIKDFPASDITEQSYLNLGIAQYSLAQGGKSEAYDQAAQTFATQFEKYPEGAQTAQARFYQAEALYARGKKAEAVPIYGVFVEKYKDNPLRPDALYALGVTQEELGKPAEAGITYDLFLKEFPDNKLKAEVVMRRAETLFAQQQFAEAEKWFATAAATPGFKLADYALVRQAASQYEQKKYADAAAIYASVAGKYPQSQYLATATMAAGNCYYLAGNLAEAEKWLGQVVAGGGAPAVEAAHWLARALLKQKKPAEALAVVEKALPQSEGGKHVADLKMDKADALYESPEKRGDAIALYAGIAKDYPQDKLAPQALYMAGFGSLGRGEYQPALDFSNEFLKAHAADPLAPDVMYVAAEASLQLAKYPEAEKLFYTLLDKYPDRADAETWKIRLGLVQFVQKKYAETVAALSPLLGSLKTPDAIAEANYLIGSSQLEQQQFEPAATSLAAALAAAPKWRQAEDTLLNLASAYRQLNKFAEAKATAGKVIAEFPNSKSLDRAHYRLGDVAYAQADYPTAAAEYQQVIDKWPDSSLVANAWYSLGWAKIGQQDYPAAIAAMTTLIDKHPKSSLASRGRYARAIARQQTKEFSGAAEDAQAFLATNPAGAEKADAQYVLGLCEAGQQKFGEAAKVFEEILKADPNYAALDKVLYELGWALKSQNKDAEALAAFERITKERPESALAAEALYHVGESQYAEKKYSDAAKTYFAAMNQAAKASGKGDLAEKASHKLAWAYYQQGQFDKAAQSFEYQVNAFGGGELAVDAQFMAAESLFKQDKFEPAYAAYQKSLAKLPSNKDFQGLAYLHAAQSLAQLKKWAEALKLLEPAIKQFADSPYLPAMMYEQAWALQNQGKADEASKIYDQVAAATDAEVGARARFMMGEIQFEKKDYKEAVRSFFKVAYGYGYPNSPDPYHKWQANAAYEAARCFETLAGQDAGKKSQMLEQAKKSYQEVLDRYPTSDKAGLAKSRLQALGA